MEVESGQRLFTCVEIPGEQQALLATVQAQFPSTLTCLRFVKPGLLHLTLHFLGQLQPSLLTALEAAARNATLRTKPFRVCLDGLNTFPNARRPRVVWGSVSEGTDDLAGLHERLGNQLSLSGLPGGKESFTPHATLARVRKGASMEELQLLATVLDDWVNRRRLHVSFRAERLTIMASRLTREGPSYTPISFHPFLIHPD